MEGDSQSRNTFLHVSPFIFRRSRAAKYELCSANASAATIQCSAELGFTIRTIHVLPRTGCNTSNPRLQVYISRILEAPSLQYRVVPDYCRYRASGARSKDCETMQANGCFTVVWVQIVYTRTLNLSSDNCSLDGA